MKKDVLTIDLFKTSDGNYWGYEALGRQWAAKITPKFDAEKFKRFILDDISKMAKNSLCG